MLVFTFLLALLFAIPTFGLSLLAWLVFLVANSMLKAKARMHYADKQQAYRNLAQSAASGQPKPSRSSVFDEIDEHAFWYAVTKLNSRRGVPALYTQGVAQNADFRELFESFLREMKDGGSSSLDLQMAGAEFIERAWDRMTEAQKQSIRFAETNGVRASQVEWNG